MTNEPEQNQPEQPEGNNPPDRGNRITGEGRPQNPGEQGRENAAQRGNAGGNMGDPEERQAMKDRKAQEQGYADHAAKVAAEGEDEDEDEEVDGGEV